VSNQSSDYSPARRVVWQSGIQPPGTQGVPNQSSSFRKFSGIQIVREVDGSPSIEADVLEVSNGTLSEPSPGVARVSTGGGATNLVHEALIGLVNGINKVFTSSAAFLPGKEIVWMDGVSLEEGSDYARSESGGVGTGFDTITFVSAPVSRVAPRDDSIVSIHYVPA